MAKEVAFTKIAKISQAQQYMILSVLGASIFLGIGISLTVHFIQQIAYNAKVIAAEEESQVAYSNFIKDTGTCQKPKGSVYSEDELKRCNPNTIEISQVDGTLRYNILQNLAANNALNSVPKDYGSECHNDATDKNYTFKELNDMYNDANDANSRQAALSRIKVCSALRVVPDALPAFRNEEALLASLNRIFNLSNWTPESLSPSGGSSTTTGSLPSGVNAMDVNLSIEADTGTTMNVLHNIERSIREFNIDRATIEWSAGNKLTLQGKASAYYMDESIVSESSKTISTGGN